MAREPDRVVGLRPRRAIHLPHRAGPRCRDTRLPWAFPEEGSMYRVLTLDVRPTGNR